MIMKTRIIHEHIYYPDLSVSGRSRIVTRCRQTVKELESYNVRFHIIG